MRRKHRVFGAAAVAAMLALSGVGHADDTITQPVEFTVDVPSVIRINGDDTLGVRGVENVRITYTQAWWHHASSSQSDWHSSNNYFVESNGIVTISLQAAAPLHPVDADLETWGASPAMRTRQINGTEIPGAGSIDYLTGRYRLVVTGYGGLEQDDPVGLTSTNGVPSQDIKGSAPTSMQVHAHDGAFDAHLEGKFDFPSDADAGSYRARILVTFTAVPAEFDA